MGRPDRDTLDHISGIVKEIEVEQTGQRDRVRFKLDSSGIRFWTYLDEGTTVTLAQLQILRESLVQQITCIVRHDSDNNRVYSVSLTTYFLFSSV